MNAEVDLWFMTLLVFVPSIFAVFLLFFPKGSEEYMRWFTLLGTAVTFVFSAVLFIDYLAMQDRKLDALNNRPLPSASLMARVDADKLKAAENHTRDDHDLVTRLPWIRNFNIEYFLGIDGISMPLILLTTVLFVLSMIASWGIEKYVKGYCMLFLILETGVLGSFVALDFFLFYIFWEVMLLPMYFLIGIWGGPRREYAASKFFLYTLLGSVFILIALLAFYFTDVRDFVQPEKSPQGRPVAAAASDKVNTFDIIVLAKAGKAALDINNGHRTEVVREIVNRTGASPAEVNGRLDQWFFTESFQYIM